MDRGSKPAVLVTGGAGYIGAHTAKALSERGFFPVVFDSLSSGFREAVRWGAFVHGDIRDARAVAEALDEYGARSVIHFAGLIEVGRSVAQPDLFWEINVAGATSLLTAMRERGVERMVFSSSAAVYGQGGRGPLETIPEDAVKAPSSPYGDTKLACEWMIQAQCKAYGLSAVALRYFNAAGADPSGLIGEAHEPETHLIPLAIAAALGDGKPLTVFGDDFDTPDGTCLRDYIHVNDLAAAHVAALEVELAAGAYEAANVGTGKGASVREVVEAVARATGRPVPHSVGARRAGDPPSLVADATRAKDLLGWEPNCSGLDRIVTDALRWEAQPAYGSGRRAAARRAAERRPKERPPGPQPRAQSGVEPPQIHLRAWRELRLLTQHELARFASTSPTMISRLESGVARPSPELLARLAAALELPETEWLRHDPNASRLGSSE